MSSLSWLEVVAIAYIVFAAALGNICLLWYAYVGWRSEHPDKFASRVITGGFKQ